MRRSSPLLGRPQQGVKPVPTRPQHPRVSAAASRPTTEESITRPREGEHWPLRHGGASQTQGQGRKRKAQPPAALPCGTRGADESTGTAARSLDLAGWRPPRPADTLKPLPRVPRPGRSAVSTPTQGTGLQGRRRLLLSWGRTRAVHGAALLLY